MRKTLTASTATPGALALLAVFVLCCTRACGAEMTAGALASRHQDAVMQARYLEYDALLERDCAQDGTERITVTGEINIDGWSLINSRLETGGTAPVRIDVRYHLRDGIAVRLARITSQDYPDSTHTEPVPEAVSQAVFQREAPMHPLYLFTAFMGSTMAIETGGEDVPRNCSRYSAFVTHEQASGTINLCVDARTGLVRYIVADMSQGAGCRFKASAAIQTLAGPPAISPADDVADAYEKASGKTGQESRPPESPQGLCALPGAPVGSVSYTSRDGLPEAPVSRLTLDRNGILWAGSRKGVARFSNNSWTLDTAGGKLFGLQITDLLARSDGSLWVATNAGIHVFRDGAWSLISTADGLPDNNVSALAEFSNGRGVWAGTMRGLGRWDKSAWQTLTTDNGLPGNDITALAIDRYGTLWAGTPQGLAIYNEGRFSKADPDLPISGQFIKTLTASPDGSVWAIAGALTGIVEMRTDSWVHHTGRTGLPCAHVAHAAADSNGCLWAACLDIQDNGHEILTYDGISWRSMDLPDGSYPYFTVPAADGSLWAATRDGVLHLFVK